MSRRHVFHHDPLRLLDRTTARPVCDIHARKFKCSSTVVPAARIEFGTLIGESQGEFLEKTVEAAPCGFQCPGSFVELTLRAELACDMRFAARETAIFGQPEQGFGAIPGAGGVQHLTRLAGRARALEILMSAEDFDADLAERYGWINRALPGSALRTFVHALAHRIAGFPAAARAALKERVNAIALAPIEDFRRDSDLFAEASKTDEFQRRSHAAAKRGFQTREGEMALAQMLGDLNEA